MADIMTIEQMQKGSLNLDTLEAWVEGAPNTTVTTPNGRVVPTMSTAVANLTTDGIMQDNKTQRQVNTELDIKINSVSGGYFKAFDTLANLNAATGMTTGQVAKVMNDTAANNGDYRYTGSAWVKGYDVLTDAKAYTDSRTQYMYDYIGGNKIGAKTPKYLNLGVNNTYQITASTSRDSVVLPVNVGDTLFIFNDKNSFDYYNKQYIYAFYADDPNINRTQSRILPADGGYEATDVASGILYRCVIVPTGARYMMLNIRFNADNIAWAVHNGAFRNSYASGMEFVYSINGTKLASEEIATNSSIALTKKATRVFDVSAYTNNYNLSFVEAISAVPSELRKQNLTIRYNNADERTFLHENVSNWLVQRLWVRQINTVVEGKINHFDERMIYSGFTIGSSGIVSTENNLHKVAIIPIVRTYTGGVENKLTVKTYPVPLKPTTIAFLKANGETVGGSMLGGVVDFTNKTIPSDAKYVAINLEAYDSSTGLVANLGNVDIAKNYLHYFPDNVIKTVTKSVTKDGATNIIYQKTTSLNVDRTLTGDRLVTPYFKSNLTPINGLHIAHFIKFVEIQKGQEDLINKATGTYRRFYITRLSKNSNGAVNVNIAFERENGDIDTPYLGETVFVAPDTDGLVYYEWKRARNADPIKIKLTIDPTHLPSDNIDFAYENAEIHPNVVADAANISGKNRGVAFQGFEEVGVATSISNQQQSPAKPLDTPVIKSLVNGVVKKTVTGTVGIEHQQTTLVNSKLARFTGKASVYVEGSANYPNNPSVKLMREPSAMPYNVGTNNGYGFLGKTSDYQYIHPDIVYAPEGVGGYKYWMANSNYPNGSDPREDVDLFVSNDGQNWTRIRGFYEADNGGLPFKNPDVYWSTPYKNSFMPIPQSGASLEFATDSGIATNTVKGFLNHDPAISYHNGYINVYILYNFNLVSASSPDTKYIVCYRTNNGIDWEIVREDGTTMPYNSTNALLIFSKTNGVRNHIYYKSGINTGLMLTPQIVKVSNTEWYYYTRSTVDTSKISGKSMDLIRFRGTNPYVFDWNNPEYLSKDAVGAEGNLWHFGMQYYNGKFYCLTNGYMLTSTDGLNFKTAPYSFFWRGMSCDIYKPTFVVGHDGKVKIAYGFQTHIAVPHPYAPQSSVDPNYPTRTSRTFVITGTLIAEYASLSDIETRSNTATKDAYIDVILISASQSTRSSKVALIPCVRSFTEVQSSLEVTYDDEIWASVILNTRHGGTLNFIGVTAALPNSALS